jgi:hypothetical protein
MNALRSGGRNADGFAHDFADAGGINLHHGEDGDARVFDESCIFSARFAQAYQHNIFRGQMGFQRGQGIFQNVTGCVTVYPDQADLVLFISRPLQGLTNNTAIFARIKCDGS